MLAQEQIFTHDSSLAARITHQASRLTYFTVFFLVDHGLVPDAYKAYAYFRWVDDTLDQKGITGPERIRFVNRQKLLVDQCYSLKGPSASIGLTREEYLLVDLVACHPESNNGLELYIRNLMAVMDFDAQRRGEIITRAQLDQYELWLATAVTEALHFYIGHDCDSPQSEIRYLAATAAHITHMLRDTFDDLESGYFNIPCEDLEKYHITPFDVTSEGYREYVKSRVEQARTYFEAGKRYLAQVENMRCRLAGYSYMAHFIPVLNKIERDGYILRPSY